MNRTRSLVGLCVLLSGCGGVMLAPQSGGGLDGLNCEVAALLTSKCTSCHGATPAGGAPYSLTSRALLLEPAPGFAGQTKADRSLARMQAQTMPSAGGNSASEIAVLQSWISAGMPAGACSSGTTAPTTCIGGTTWTLGNTESQDMNPGMACLSCHQQQEGPLDQFMGTVFRSAHEQDTCNAQPPAGLVVDITGADGRTITIPVRSGSGNFLSETLPPVTTPYRAQVRDTAGRTMKMSTPQTSGDCNSCHTEQGANGAGGRIIWPQ